MPAKCVFQAFQQACLEQTTPRQRYVMQYCPGVLFPHWTTCDPSPSSFPVVVPERLKRPKIIWSAVRFVAGAIVVSALVGLVMCR